MNRLSQATWPEVRKVAFCTGAGTVIMLIAFFCLHLAFPVKVPFDCRVVISGVIGGGVAVGNFYLTARNIERIVDLLDPKEQQSSFRKCYMIRNLIVLGWIALAILVPCFQYVAAIIPLLFPGIGIKLCGIFGYDN